MINETERKIWTKMKEINSFGSFIRLFQTYFTHSHQIKIHIKKRKRKEISKLIKIYRITAKKGGKLMYIDK